MRTLTYFVGITLDGFIAGPDHSYDFFPVGADLMRWIADEYPETLPTHLHAPLGARTEFKHFDTVIMGRGTYLPGLAAGITSPYAHLRQLVVSSTLGPSADAKVEVVAEDPLTRVRQLKREPGKGLYLAGGGKLAGAVLPEIDALVLKVYPVVTGKGIPLFHSDFSATQFKRVENRPFDSGATVLSFVRA